MKSTIEAMKQALKMLNYCIKEAGPCEHDVGVCVCNEINAATVLREAIKREEAQSVEPVGEVVQGAGTMRSIKWKNGLLPLSGLLFARPAPPSISEPVEHTSGFALAAIGRNHEGNPIPKEWYTAARELLSYTAAMPSSAVTCQIYGHVVGACGECNTHADADVNATNAKLASNYLELVAKTEKENLHNQCELQAKIKDLETELARVKAKWQDDYLTLNDVCNKQIKLEAAGKLALSGLILIRKQLKSWDDGDAAVEALKKAGIK